MEIKGKVHCFFEQSGTFKNEFKKLGYEAIDYDIQNEFGETDYIIDLFNAINTIYDNQDYSNTVFTSIKHEDLIIAFFPCIYFNQSSMLAFTFNCINYRKLTEMKKIDSILIREKARSYYYRTLLKLVHIVYNLNLRLIIENPATKPHYLMSSNFIKEPDIIDNNRLLRGDYFKKPTAYWFFNCVPVNGLFSYQKDKQQKIITETHDKKGIQAGVCDMERSLISSDYARNFICDFILGKEQNITELELFRNV